MNEKTMTALSELNWLEIMKTANQLSEISEYMLMTDLEDYDAEKVDLYAGLVLEDVEELKELSNEINTIFEDDFRRASKSS